MPDWQVSDEWKIVPGQPPVVFLDTGPLLTMWGRWWKCEPIDDPCFTDPTARRVTSHKCVTELHNIFRGRANKKQGECQKQVLRYLGPEYESATPQGLADHLHITVAEANFRYGQARWQQAPDPDLVRRYVNEGDQPHVQPEWEAEQPFRKAVRLHEELIGKGEAFLNRYAIRVMPVTEVFAPRTLGDWYSFVEEGIIRSEDLEIVFAAEVAHADLFITGDKELIRDTLTLPQQGHQASFVRSLSFPNFWRQDQYKDAMERLHQGGLIKKLDEIE